MIRRYWLLVFVALLCGVLKGYSRDSSDLFRSDLIAYRAASTLFFANQNPYSSVAMDEIQRRAISSLQPTLMVWNPPILFVLFGRYFIADIDWIRFLSPLMTFISVAFLAAIGWQVAASAIGSSRRGASTKDQFVLLVLTLSFYPLWKELLVMQFSAQLVLIILVGILLFLSGKDLLAGALLSIGLIKPHLMFLPLLLTGLWVVAGRRYQVILGAAVTTFVSFGIAELCNRGITWKWIAREQWPVEFYGASTSSLLRILLTTLEIPISSTASLLAPLLLLAMYVYWRGRRLLKPGIPELICALAYSPLVTPYGFIFDQISLITVLAYVYCQELEQTGRSSTTLYGAALLAISAITSELYLTLPINPCWHIYPPVIFYLYTRFERSTPWTENNLHFTKVPS